MHTTPVPKTFAPVSMPADLVTLPLTPLHMSVEPVPRPIALISKPSSRSRPFVSLPVQVAPACRAPNNLAPYISTTPSRISPPALKKQHTTYCSPYPVTTALFYI
jgi:hypothetical protein